MSSLKESILQLKHFIEQHPRLFVLTGAGISTDSGIPDYRDDKGQWKTSQPIQGPEFIRSTSVQKRYWARSLIGWRNFGVAKPNRAHRALAALERHGYVHHIVTQNVDRLHQRAGSTSVTDLHGRLDKVICLDCQAVMARATLQTQLEALNPNYLNYAGKLAPDGDVHINHIDFEGFNLVQCQQCGGPLKPDVVFYGENVPPQRVQSAMAALETCDAVLVVGSSLMVYSGFRFCRAAAGADLPQAAINIGITRADEMFNLKIKHNCSDTLNRLEQLLGPKQNKPQAHATGPL